MIRVHEVKIRVDLDSPKERLKKVAKLLKVKPDDILKLEIKKQSIDARHNQEVFFVYDFLVTLQDEQVVLKQNKSLKVFKEEARVPLKVQVGKQPLEKRIIVVGLGPAGLLASYYLALYGFKPLIIERGKRLADRIKDVELFWQENILNPESNVQFGEGGAGTFSDGKLNTLVKDKDNLIKEIFKIFVKHGAPQEILYLQNPHIGSDILREVITNLVQEIIKLGGEIRYQTKLTNLKIAGNKLEAIEVNNKEIIPCQNLVLAIGHSARDTFLMLTKHNLAIINKPFAIGVRVMHPQAMIDENQYGKFKKYLKPANYKLTYQTTSGRGVYSFCMCPGGYVVNASSIKEHLVINGMSNYKRDTKVSNSAIVVTVSKDDYGTEALAGLKLQNELEKLAYQQCGGKIPLQLWKDFKENKKSFMYGKFKPILKGDYEFTNLRDFLPSFITESLMEAIPNFDLKIKGFARDDMILAGIETRTSSPIRILRDENLEANIQGIYPIGEGAGYAGGITTSALDGMKIALKLIQKYRP